MRSLTFLVVFCLALPTAFSLGFMNSQLPVIPQSATPGVLVGKVDPSLKFAPSYVQQLKPFSNGVLLSIQQAAANQAWSQNRAVVVRPSAVIAAAEPLLVEGATVTVSAACTAVFLTAADVTTKYPGLVGHPAKINSLIGKYVNGVSLNNGNPLTLHTVKPSATTTSPFDETASNQQHNYVLCQTTDIYGVINKETWGANRANIFTSRITKPVFGTTTHPDDSQY
jgi:azurin